MSNFAQTGTQNELTRRDLLGSAAGLIALLHPSWLEAASALAPTFAAPSQPVDFRHLRMRTRRLEEMEHFYRTVLEFPQVGSTNNSRTFRAGGTELEFVQVPDGPDPVYHFAFNIPENKLEAGQQWLAPRCPIVTRPDGSTVYNFAHWNAHALYFLDPSGNILEFIARHNLKNAAPGPFRVDDILYASEIGLVVPDVPRAVENLKRLLSLEVYVGASDVFAPVGDEHGLFIVVKEGRRWLGSDRHAATFPVDVHLRGTSSGNIALPDGPFRVNLKG